MASKLVTVFGGSGFLGRRIVEHLAAAGHDVRVGVRHPDRAAFLRRLDRDGRIELVQADVWDEATVTRAVDGAASVINTVGHYVEKGRTTFDRIHGEGALHVARQTKQEGALRLIHISGLGADPGSDSPYVRARGTGESLVKEAFDGVTILRPGVIFGPDDSFLNRLAMLARPRDRVIQRDTVYSGRILQRPDFWDRVPGSGVADGWWPRSPARPV